MKLIYAIVQNKDAGRLSKKLNENNIRATRLASTGGFLSEGNATFIIGVQDEKVDSVLELIKDCSQKRQEFVNPVVSSHVGEFTQPLETTVDGATVFVAPVDEFKRF